MNQSELQDIVSALQRGDFAFFLGAACSAPLGYPVGSDLALRLQQEFPGYVKSEKTANETLASLDSTLDALITMGVAREKIERLIQQIFTPENTKRAQNPYLVLKQLINKARRKPVYVFTTNWDTALDDALKGTGRVSYIRDKEGLQRLVTETPDIVVVKLRGDVGNENLHVRPNLVLTTKEAEQRRKEFQGIYSFFEGKEAERRLLIIGYRMADQDILALYDNIRGGSTKQVDYLIVAGRTEEETTLDTLGQKYPSLKVHRDEYVLPFLTTLTQAMSVTPQINSGFPLKFDKELETILTNQDDKKDKKSILVTGFKYSGKSSCITRFSLKAGNLLSQYELVDLPEYTADEDFETITKTVKNSYTKPALIFLQDHQQAYFEQLHKKKFGSGLFDSLEHISIRMEIKEEEARELYRQFLLIRDDHTCNALSQRKNLEASIIERSKRNVRRALRTHITCIPALIKTDIDKVCEAIEDQRQPIVESDLLDKRLEEQEALLNERADYKEYIYASLGLSVEWLAPETETLVTAALSFFGTALGAQIPALPILPILSSGLSTAGIGILGLGLLHGLYSHHKHKDKTVLGYIATADDHWGKLSDEEKQLVGYEFESKNNLRPGTGYSFLASLFSKSTPANISKSIDAYFDEHPEIWHKFTESSAGKQLSAELLDWISNEFETRLDDLRKTLSEHSEELSKIRLDIAEIKDRLYTVGCEQVANVADLQAKLGLGTGVSSEGAPEFSYVGRGKSDVDRRIRETLLGLAEAADTSFVLVTGQPGGGKSVLLFMLGEMLLERTNRVFYVRDMNIFPIADFQKVDNSYAIVDATEEIAQRFCKRIAEIQWTGSIGSKIIVSVRTADLRQYISEGRIGQLKIEPLRTISDAGVAGATTVLREFEVRYEREVLAEMLTRELARTNLSLEGEAFEEVIRKSELLPLYIREAVKFLEEQRFFEGNVKALSLLPTGIENLILRILKTECGRFPELILIYYYVSHYQQFPTDLVDGLRRVLRLSIDCYPRYCDETHPFSCAEVGAPRLLSLHSWYKDIIDRNLEGGVLHFQYVLNEAYSPQLAEKGLSTLSSVSQGTFDELSKTILEKASAGADGLERLDLILWEAIHDSISYVFGSQSSAQGQLQMSFGEHPLNYILLYSFLKNQYLDLEILIKLGHHDNISIYETTIFSLVELLGSTDLRAELLAKKTDGPRLLPLVAAIRNYRGASIASSVLIIYRNLGLTRVEKYVDQAIYFFLTKEYDQAIKSLDVAFPHGFGDLGPWTRILAWVKGQVLAGLGRYEEALKEFDATIQGKHEGADFIDGLAWDERGRVLYDSKKYKEALQAFESAIEIESKAVYYNHEAVSLIKLDRYEEAINELDAAIQLQPDVSTFHSNKANALRLWGRLEKAIEEENIAIKLDPTDPLAHIDMGRSLSSLKRYDEAITEFDIGMQIDPTNSGVHNSKGMALINLNRYEEALKEYDDAIKLNPHDPSYHNNKGHALTKVQRCEDAVKECEIAIRLNPTEPLYHCGKGIALLRLTRYQEGLNEIEISIQLDRENSLYHQYKAIALDGLGRHDEAVVQHDIARRLALLK